MKGYALLLNPLLATLTRLINLWFYADTQSKVFIRSFIYRGIIACAVFFLVVGCGADSNESGEYRSLTGIRNNLSHPFFGAAMSTLIRTTDQAYEDGSWSLAGSDRPNPRLVSRVICTQDSEEVSPSGPSSMLWQWGQFLDHDIVRTAERPDDESISIQVPTGDPFFDPFSTGSKWISMGRSMTILAQGVFQQKNLVSAFIDGSQIYGNDPDRSELLRNPNAREYLDISAGNLLPYNTHHFPNGGLLGLDRSETLFIAGDDRVNEQPGLTALHTLFVREHNSLVDILRTRYPSFSPEELYQHARSLVIAELEFITFHEFLPLLLGEDALPPDSGYDESVHPGIANEFSTAAFRFGHSMIPSTLLRLDENLSPLPTLETKNAFFDPSLTETVGIDPILRGLSYQRSQNLDAHLISDLQNFLFGPPGSGGLDLASLNIQRGRDHGLPSYNELRRQLGLSEAADFSDISVDAPTQTALQTAYSTVDKVDAWVGGLSEPPYGNGLLGELFHNIVKEQFLRLRKGDRFWYTRSLWSNEWIDWVESQSLREIILRNTQIGEELPNDIFWIH